MDICSEWLFKYGVGYFGGIGKSCEYENGSVAGEAAVILILGGGGRF